MNQPQTQPDAQQAPTHVALPLPLVQAIGDFLIKQPYKDVAHLIKGMEQGQPLTVQQEAGGEVASGPAAPAA